MLVFGKADTLWPSCPMSDQMVARLKARRFRHAVPLLEYDNAGHAMYGLPLDPTNPRLALLAELGGTVEDNQPARKDSWARSMVFLDSDPKTDSRKIRSTWPLSRPAVKRSPMTSPA